MTCSTKREAREKAKKIVNGWALGLAATAWIPGSHYVMAAGDYALVEQLGSVFDVSVNKTEAAQIFTLIAVPLVGSKVAHSILDFIPVLGWGVKSVVAAGATKAAGEALIKYFYNCSKLPP